MSAVPTSCPGATPTLAEPKPTPSEVRCRYRTHGLGDASEEELVKHYLPLVKTIAGRLAITLPPHVDTEDLESAGLAGLLQALRRFEPERGVTFESYARTRIRGAMLDELRRMDWVPRSVHAKARKTQNIMSELEQALGRLPTEEEMAAALGMSPREYRQWLDEIRPAAFVSLDAVRSQEGDDDSSEHEAIADVTQADTFDRVSRAELAGLIATRIQQLPEVHRKVIALYYYEGLRLREIAEVFGLCESRICQIHTQAILAIRSYVDTLEAVPRP